MHSTEITLSGYRAIIAKKLPYVLLGTAGSKGNEKLLITRGTGWEGLTVKAVFHPQRIEVLVPESGKVDVPWEVTGQPPRPEETGKIVFHGVDEATGRVLVTHDIEYKVSGHSPADGTPPGAPTPSVWEQWVANAGGVVNEAAAVVDREAVLIEQLGTAADLAAASATEAKAAVTETAANADNAASSAAAASASAEDTAANAETAKQSAEAAAKIADVGVDTTLSTSGAAADAAVTGERMDVLKAGLYTLEDSLYNLLVPDATLWEQGVYNDDLSKSESNWGVRIKAAVPVLKKGVYRLRVADSSYRIKIFIVKEDAALYSPAWVNSEMLFSLHQADSLVMHIGKTNGKAVSTDEIQTLLDNFSLFYDAERSAAEDLSEWEYKTLDKTNALVGSGVRMAKKIACELNRLYTFSCADGYGIYVCSFSEGGELLEERGYNTTIRFQTRDNVAYFIVVIKNTQKESAVIGDAPFDFAISVSKSFYYRENMLTRVSWENASIDSSGDRFTNEWSYQRILSDYIPLTAETTVSISFSSETYLVAVSFYNKDKKYVGDFFDGNYFNADKYMQGSEGYIRVVMRNKDSSAIDPNEVADCGVVFKDTNLSYGADASKKTRLRVMTNNLGHFGWGVTNGYESEDYEEKVKQWISHFNSSSIDICGIQEYATHFRTGYEVPAKRNIFDYCFDTFLTGASHTAIGSLVDIVSVDVDVLGASDPKTMRAYMHAVLNKDGCLIDFYNVHLHPHDVDARTAQADELLAILSEKSTFICTGDFNADSADEYDKFKNAGFELANCGAFGVINTNRYTTDDPIDNIIASANAKITNVEKVEEFVTSDHNALIADIFICS